MGEPRPPGSGRAQRAYVCAPAPVGVRPELDERIETIPPGYRLNLVAGELDAVRFDEVASTAARLADIGDSVAALDGIGEAEGLWRGRPFGEFGDEPWARAEVERLTELHVGLRERRAEMLLEAGRVGASLATANIVDFPMQELAVENWPSGA